MRIRYHRQTIREMRGSHRFYLQCGATVEAGFLRDLDEAESRILMFPFAWAPTEHGTRTIRLARYPHSLIYVVTGSDCIIVAVAHKSRRDGYWHGRMKSFGI